MKRGNTYAFNFAALGAHALVKCAASNDTIGVLKMVDGWLEFWRHGERRIRTRSWTVLFKAINKIERDV